MKRRPRPTAMAAVTAFAAALAVAAPTLASADDEPRSRAFDDPFVRATAALPCAEPAAPTWTAAEARLEAHARAERGTSCFRDGRCRLPNAYLYDREIVPRVARLLAQDERFAASSVWVLGQRRWVFLKGCVADAAVAEAMEREVRRVDDVEAVIVELAVVRGPPR